jgi:hypothetical protein
MHISAKNLTPSIKFIRGIIMILVEFFLDKIKKDDSRYVDYFTQQLEEEELERKIQTASQGCLNSCPSNTAKLSPEDEREELLRHANRRPKKVQQRTRLAGCPVEEAWLKEEHQPFMGPLPEIKQVPEEWLNNPVNKPSLKGHQRVTRVTRESPGKEGKTNGFLTRLFAKLFSRGK